MADRIVVMRDGVVQQVGTTAEVYDSRPTPSSPRSSAARDEPDSPVASRGPETRASSCLRPSRCRSIGPSCPAADAPVTLGIRPEDIELGSADQAIVAGTVELVENIGAEDFISVSLGALTCIVRTTVHSAAREGERVHLRFPTHGVHLFDGAGQRVERQA